MPSRYDRAVDVTTRSIDLVAIPVLATVLSVSKIARVLEAGRGTGVTFPFPSGLPTLWTYVSVPSGSGAGGAITGPLSVVAFVPLFVFGLVVTSALEAGLLGVLWGRINNERRSFVGSVSRFAPRMVGVNLLRFAVVLLAVPFMVVPPLAIVLVVVLSYFVYGLPFELVVTDAGIGSALESTVEHAFEGGVYATFGVFHLILGGIASFVLTTIVRNAGLPGIILGAIVVAGPAVFVACYGLCVFEELDVNSTK